MDQLREVLSMMKDPSKRPPVEHHDIYTDKDPVVQLDDGSFLRAIKIRNSQWQKPGVLQVYAPWCPHCQSKVKCITDLSKNLQNTTFYVLDATVNPMFRFSNNVKAYPSFYKVLDNGEVGDLIDGDMPEVIAYLKTLGEGIETISECSA
jgi:hypothetical protein